jgi:hypothetical protein
MSEEKKTPLKELKEGAKAIGYLAGEITEATKDGLGIEDLKSVKDIIDNQAIVRGGIEGIDEASLKGLSYDEILGVLLSMKEGFDIGIK